MKLAWLDKVPEIPTGITFGLPWSKGEITEDHLLKGFELNHRPVQSWATAYWPDGTIKWTAHSGIASVDDQGLELSVSKEQPQTQPDLYFEEDETQLKIDNGLISVTFNKTGTVLIQEITNQQSETLAKNGRLISTVQTIEKKEQATIRKDYVQGTTIVSVLLERIGSLQATIKISGHMGENRLLPFEFRVKLYKDSPVLTIVSTHFYNGDSDKDFVSSLGFELETVLKGEAYNRQVRLASGQKVYNEAAQNLATRRYRSSSPYREQLEGQMIQKNAETEAILSEAESNAIWNDYTFYQNTASSGVYRKRTHQENAWLTVPAIEQSDGLLYSGGEAGGLAIGLRSLAEKFPSQLSINHLNEDVSKATIWFWSAEHEPMDLRHYDKKTHVDAAYEGFHEMRATPVGISNTDEAMIVLFDHVPKDEELIEYATQLNQPPLLIAQPEYYFGTKATGEWSPVSKVSEADQFIEEQLQCLLDYYIQEIEQRSWKGYWNFGDIMHSYDKDRHQWFYDTGGYAWQNTELVPNLWLWYSFFRTGSTDIFRMVEAMSRHNSEVDRYHFGEYAGLGSRHNVSHWGCGCKEARISMACLYKYFHYLTGDERMKDLLEETNHADETLEMLDPMREFYEEPEKKGVTHARLGPDWAAFTSNWLSKWERDKDPTALKSIQTGLDVIKASPHRLLSGPTFEYDTTSKELIYIGTPKEGAYHMEIAFGAPQVWIELAELLEDDQFKDMIAEFGNVYAMEDQQMIEQVDSEIRHQKFAWPMFSAGLVAYAAKRLKNPELLKISERYLFDEEISGVLLPIQIEMVDTWKELKEIPWITTNVAAQWSLNVLMYLKYRS